MTEPMQHPKFAVAIERQVARSPEGYELRKAIAVAMFAYQDFLDRHGLIWDVTDPDLYELKATAIVARLDNGNGGTEIFLEGGPIDTEPTNKTGRQ